MTTRQYIGARYVPVFADPVEWDDTREYEHLMMVQHVGETYISQQAVPIGAQLPDTDHGEESNEYWVHMSNWNAQVESYRQEVLAYNGRISTLEDDLPIADFDNVNTVKAELTSIENVLPIAAFDNVNTVDARFDTIEANGWVTETRIADDSISTAKLKDKSVTLQKLADGINPSEIVFLGDSWSVTGTTMPFDWLDYVASSLNLTKHVFAQGSSGFCDNTDSGGGTVMNFVDQITYAANNMADDDKANTKYIVALGGLNDIASSYTGSQIYTNVMSMITVAKQHFPNAQMHVFGINLSNHLSLSNFVVFKRYLNKIELACNNSSGYAIAHTDLLWKLFILDTGCYQADDLHPTEYGDRKIGYMVKRAIMGENTKMYCDAENPLSFTFHSRFGGSTENLAFALDTDTLYNSGIYYTTPNLTENLAAGSEYAIGQFTALNAPLMDISQPVVVYANVGGSNKFVGYTYLKGNSLMIKTIEPITSGTAIHPIWPIKLF